MALLRTLTHHHPSNAGFIFFGTMLRQLALHDERTSSTAAPSHLGVLAATSGIIIDSAPSRLTPAVASRQARSLMLQLTHFLCFLHDLSTL